MKKKTYYLKTEDDSLCDLKLSKLLCPVCNGRYNHKTRIVKRSGHDNYQAWKGRGNLIEIFMHGECGHNWSLSIGFHKGESFIFCKQTRKR